MSAGPVDTVGVSSHYVEHYGCRYQPEGDTTALRWVMAGDYSLPSDYQATLLAKNGW